MRVWKVDLKTNRHMFILSAAESTLYLICLLLEFAAPASALISGLSTLCFIAAICALILQLFLDRLSKKVFLKSQGHLYRLYAYANANNPSLEFLKNWPDSRLCLLDGQTPEEKAADLLTNPSTYLLISEEIIEVYQIKCLPFCCHVRAYVALPGLTDLYARSFFFIASETLLEEFSHRQYEN